MMIGKKTAKLKEDMCWCRNNFHAECFKLWATKASCVC